jgi:predicted SnoaL-like aldol condensation-catalyzing enzyme
VPTGRAGFVQFFSQFAKPVPIQEKIQAPLVDIVAEGNLVVLSFVQELPEPTDPSKTYTTTWFDMFRVEGNKIAEHWDPTVKHPVEKVASVQIDDDQLKQYVGTFKITSITPPQPKFPPDAAIEITFENHQLMLDMSGRGLHTSGVTDISAQSPDNFVDKDGSTVHFGRDATGSINQATLNASGLVFTGQKQGG